VVFLHKEKKQYQGNDWTGNWERAGFGDMGYLVQASLKTTREGSDFSVAVMDNRYLPELNGAEFEGGMAQFQYLALSLIPDSEPEDWEDE
jgi:hypothetical protein